MKLRGLDGSHLFGFLATFGLLRLLDGASLSSGALRPRLYFDRDCHAALEGVPSVAFVEDALRQGLQELHARLTADFASIDRPGDLTEEAVEEIVKTGDARALDDLAGLGCCIDGVAHESTLCAANGAGHQNLVLSMRDVLSLLEAHPDALRAAIERPWTLAFEPTREDRKKLDLKNRKPTLRLDPSDERLYALRADDPTSSDATYRTELGAQALAAAAFGGLPVVPRRHPVTVGSERVGLRTYFYWGLWSVPATYPAVRSLLATGMRDPQDARSRGIFTAFRVARVTGPKGKLSFAPTEPWW